MLRNGVDAAALSSADGYRATRDAGSKPTKSQRILALYDGKRTTKEIAKIVGCRQEYVRVVSRQRKGKSSTHDLRYRSSFLGKASQRATNANRRDAMNAYEKELLRTCDKAKARAAARKAYLAAQRVGKSIKDAKNFAKAARGRVVSRTGDHTAARRAYAQATRSVGEKAVL
jgi:hypothetical protein